MILFICIDGAWHGMHYFSVQPAALEKISGAHFFF